jgi:hypothetical protein
MGPQKECMLQKQILTWAQLNPSMTNWWALAISLKLLVWLNCSEISWNKRIWQCQHIRWHAISTTIICDWPHNLCTCPKVYPAPRGEIPQPHRSSGSDHRRSHIGPSWGTSWTRSKFRMLSRVSIDGDNPPCKQNISDSTYEKEKQVECQIH